MRQILILTAVTALVVAALASGVIFSERAGAQADFVTTTVRVTPEAPQPEDDVTIRMRASGCRGSNALTQIYLTSDDGASLNAALMAESSSRPTMLFRTRDEITLEEPPPGWYGLRVVCGLFRPPPVPMQGTRFQVGSTDSVEFELTGDEFEKGGILGIQGEGCPGERVELDIRPVGIGVTPFLERARIEVEDDGSWGSLVDVPELLDVGPAEVRARCAITNQSGETAFLNYDAIIPFTVIPSSEQSTDDSDG